MPTKHQVTDSKGQTHKRTSHSRVYSHAVVTHVKARPADGNWRARPAYSRAEWASRLDLAQRVAASKHGNEYLESVEIIEAVRS